jgi:hypothetical protein
MYPPGNYNFDRICKNIVNVYPHVDLATIKEGLCLGLAMLYAQGVFCGEHTLFNKQLNTLSQLNWRLGAKTYDSLNEVINQAQLKIIEAQRQLSPEDRKRVPIEPEYQQYLDTRAFMDALLGYHGLLHICKAQNPNITASLFMSSKLEPNTHWHLLYDNVLYLNKDDLAPKLAELVEQAKRLLQPGYQNRMVLLMYAHSHAIALAPQAPGLYSLHNHGVTKLVKTSVLAQEIFNAFYSDPIEQFLLSVSLYTMPSFLARPIRPKIPHPVIDYYCNRLASRIQGGKVLDKALDHFTRRYGLYASYSAAALGLSAYLLSTFVKLIISWVVLHGEEADKKALEPY